MQNDDQYIADQAEFDRLFVAGRGTLRIELIRKELSR